MRLEAAALCTRWRVTPSSAFHGWRQRRCLGAHVIPNPGLANDLDFTPPEISGGWEWIDQSSHGWRVSDKNVKSFPFMATYDLFVSMMGMCTWVPSWTRWKVCGASESFRRTVLSATGRVLQSYLGLCAGKGSVYAVTFCLSL